MNEEVRELIKEWGKIAEKYEEDKHFNFGDQWNRVRELKELVEEYINSPTKENLEKFWNKSAKYIFSLRTSPLGNIEAEEKGILGRYSLNELAEVFNDMLKTPPEKVDTKKLKYWESRKAEPGENWKIFGELYGKLHVEEAPIVNSCTIEALYYLGFLENMKEGKYEKVKDAFEKFKEEYRTIMKQSLKKEYATKGTTHEVPINYEIDQFFNVIDKIKNENDIEGAKEKEIEDFYKKVLDIKKHQKQIKKVGMNYRKIEFEEGGFLHLNQIYYGPPGTGKTFEALKTGIEKFGEENYQIITFHPSYDYTDFVEGVFPNTNKQSGTLIYEIKDGVLKKIAAKALFAALHVNGHIQEEKQLDTVKWSEVYEIYNSVKDKDKINWDTAHKFLLIIDEINRGDVSRIFGELITIVEEDKRLGGKNELLVELPYSQERFGLPKNLYIIGTMNTADKSIAHFDVALRRRFVFKEFLPDFKKVRGIPNHVRSKLEKLNQKLSEEPDIGWQKQIGHSYFMKMDNEGTYIGNDELDNVVKTKLLPLLEDYFFYDKRKLVRFLKDRVGIQNITTDYESIGDKLVEWLKNEDVNPSN